MSIRVTAPHSPDPPCATEKEALEHLLKGSVPLQQAASPQSAQRMAPKGSASTFCFRIYLSWGEAKQSQERYLYLPPQKRSACGEANEMEKHFVFCLFFWKRRALEVGSFPFQRVTERMRCGCMGTTCWSLAGLLQAMASGWSRTPCSAATRQCPKSKHTNRFTSSLPEE